jgi:hypothetical protein
MDLGVVLLERLVGFALVAPAFEFTLHAGELLLQLDLFAVCEIHVTFPDPG